VKERRVRLTYENVLPPLTADRMRIYQVFENLLINALRYGCDVADPEILIGSRETADEVQIYIKDKGRGIAKEYQARIFGLFQRLDPDNKGTGVGLTIVASAMRRHSGRVWIESEPGQGATFWLALPKHFTPNGEDYDENC
jgi:signal transduction histidine kinase